MRSFVKFPLICKTEIIILTKRKANGFKMHLSVALIIFVSCMVPAAGSLSADSVGYEVSEVVGVFSSNSFHCKLDNYKPARSVRFRVNLSDTKGITREGLAERLKFANEVELRNITFLNYFRIEADLWIDGQLFMQKPCSKAAHGESRIPGQPAGTTSYQFPEASSSKKRLLPLERVREPAVTVQQTAVMIWEILNTSVDCSMLSDDTPLSEALTLLAESVEPHLPLLVQWNDLRANALIEKETPIGVNGFGRMKLRQALDTVLRSVSAGGPPLALMSEGGIITLGAGQTLLNRKSTQVYAIPDLLSPPSTADTYNQGGYGGRGFKHY